MIPKEIVDKAASQFGLRCDPLNQTLEKQADCVFGYKEGVKFAEEYLKDLTIGFYSWMQQYQDLSSAIRINEVENTKELFEIFIKERNE